jgi:hypothetical protein
MVKFGYLHVNLLTCVNGGSTHCATPGNGLRLLRLLLRLLDTISEF